MRHCEGHIETLLKEEMRKDWGLGRDPVLMCACVHAHTIALSTEETRVIVSH